MKQTIRIKYFTDKIEKLTYIDGKSDWIDLRAAEDVSLKKGEFALIPLGIAMELPQGYEAHVVPRSSTFKNFGVIQTNHMGVIDESYCGDNDQWFMPVIAMEDTTINVNDRICQFRIMKKMPKVHFDEVVFLSEKDRGGIGSTGRKQKGKFMSKEDKMLYTVKDVASTFGVNVHVVYELIKKGLLPALKLGSLKIRKKSLESFLEKYDGMDLSDLDNITELK